jgi:hypothetical protein
MLTRDLLKEKSTQELAVMCKELCPRRDALPNEADNARKLLHKGSEGKVSTMFPALERSLSIRAVV